MRNSRILVLWYNDKNSELRNSEILFLLKVLNYEKVTKKLAITSQFDLTGFYDIIMRNSVF